MNGHPMTFQYTPLVEPSLDPCHEEVDDAGLAFGRDWHSFRNLPPLFKATAAATGACVLRLEHGMSAHRSLFSVIWRISRSKASANKVLAMPSYSLKPFFDNVLSICRRKLKPTAKPRLCQPCKRLVNRVHGDSPAPTPHSHQRGRITPPKSMVPYEL